MLHHGDRHLVEIGHLPQDMGSLRFLGKKIAATGDAVFEGQGIDLQGAIFHD